MEILIQLIKLNESCVCDWNHNQNQSMQESLQMRLVAVVSSVLEILWRHITLAPDSCVNLSALEKRVLGVKMKLVHICLGKPFILIKIKEGP